MYYVDQISIFMQVFIFYIEFLIPILLFIWKPKINEFQINQTLYYRDIEVMMDNKSKGDIYLQLQIF
jgi:hypothetical protein